MFRENLLHSKDVKFRSKINVLAHTKYSEWPNIKTTAIN